MSKVTVSDGIIVAFLCLGIILNPQKVQNAWQATSREPLCQD